MPIGQETVRMVSQVKNNDMEKKTISEALGNNVFTEGINPWINIYREEDKVEDTDDPEWRRTTKAMNIDGIGVVLHTYTQIDDVLSESSVFIPGAKAEDGKIVKA